MGDYKNFIEPRFPVNEEHFKDNASTEIGDLEKKGVKYASISFLLFYSFNSLLINRS